MRNEEPGPNNNEAAPARRFEDLPPAAQRALKEAELKPPPPVVPLPPEPGPGPGPQPPEPQPGGGDTPEPDVDTTRTLTLSGTVPADSWNRVGTKLIPKLRSGDGLTIEVTMRVTVDGANAQTLQMEIKQVLEDLGIGGSFHISERR